MRVKIKKALLKDTFKEIKKSYKRFISILLMALLGVGFFAGLRASSPDMVDSIDTYYKNQNVYDIEVMSTLGLTESNLEALANIENVENVYGTYSRDGLIKTNEKEIVSKILCVDDVNTPVLVEGNMPENIDECVVEKDFLEGTGKKIGDYIDIEPEKIENTGATEGEETEYLKNKTLKIVGVVESPLYISRERGSTKLGTGVIDYYIYVNKENVNSEVYTEIYITLENRDKYQTGSNKYEDYVEETKDKIEEIKEERENARYQELIDEANAEITKAEEEFNTEKQNGETQLQDAENKINEGKAQIESGEAEINSNERTANQEFKNAEAKIESAKMEVAENALRLNNEKIEAEKGFEEAENQKAGLQSTLENINNAIKITDNSIAEKQAQLETAETEEEIAAIKQQIAELQATKQVYETNKQSVEAGITQIDNQIASGRQELQSAEAQIESARNQIQSQEATLQQTKNKTYAQIANARKELEASKQEIESAEVELEEARAEFNSKIEEAEGKLIDAREKVSEIEKAQWYILDRQQNAGYSSYIQDTQSIENLSVVFPIVFFAIAALVSLTSMTRMVEEERQEIGTLKALGYNKFHIMLKYLIYSSLACIIGGVIGMNIGFQLLPRIIWDMYEMMYTLPEFIVSFNHQYSSIGLGLIYVCIVGATLYTILKEVKETPATLLRPKAPKYGKRVLLERVGFIWKRLKFSHKVTVRNIFRYKKRFLMTIIGIMGCTSLILAGFGIKDSIASILPNQYEDICHYDMLVSLKTALTEEQKNTYIENLKQKEDIQEVVETYMESGTAGKDNNSETVQIVVPSDNQEIDKMIKLRDVKTEEPFTLSEEGIIITDKLAELINAKVGDMIKVTTADNIEKEIKVAGITENYISHYVYMSKELYQQVFGETYHTNVLLIQDNNLSEEQEEAVMQEMVAKNEVSTVTLTTTTMKTLDDTMNSLNYVVVILIVSAGLLAFVVLYNLSNINIGERIRELATIKVLGFYDREVYDYVTRETVILTIIGILLGLVAGYFLNFYILGTCEINILRFEKVIHPISYLYATVITLVFSVIVNIVTYFALKKIDMIGSLKSVE